MKNLTADDFLIIDTHSKTTSIMKHFTRYHINRFVGKLEKECDSKQSVKRLREEMERYIKTII